MRLSIEPSRIVLHTRATPAVLALLPQLEGRRTWLKGGVGLAVERSGHNLDLLRSLPGVVVEGLPPSDPHRPTAANLEFDVATTARGLPPDEKPSGAEPTPSGKLDLDVARYLPDKSGYKSKSDPHPHQVVALAKARGKRAFALFMEQGTGKTKVGIDYAGELICMGELTGILVVSKRGPHRQWIETELPKHAGFKYEGHFWPKIKALPRYDASRVEVIAFNWDGIKAKNGYALATEFCQRHKGKLLIIADESQEMKNHRSDRHITLMSLRKYASHRLLLTGTPIAKDLTDEYVQLKWLDENILGIKYLQSFRNSYCIMGGFEGRAVVGQKNVDHFKAKTEPFTFRVTKAQIGLLPKSYADWAFDMTREQRDMIRGIKEDLKFALQNGTVHDVQTGALSLLKIQQISCGFIIDKDKVVHRLMPLDKNPRMLAIAEYVEGTDGKFALWSRFREELRMLEEMMTSLGQSFVSYHGGTPEAQRADNIKSFLDPEGARGFIANPQSAGTGLNLQGGCNRVGYVSNSFNAIDRWQSEDRFHRIGTNGIVEYTDFIARGSIDRLIVRNLKKKLGISQLVLDDIRRLVTEDWE